MNNDEQRIKLIKRTLWALVTVVVVIVVVIVAIQIIVQLGRGHLIVTTNSSANTISILESAVGKGDHDNVGTSPPQILQSGHSASLDPGTYVVTVKGQGGSSASKTVSVRARQTSKYAINLAPAASLEPVADVNALYFSANKTHLYYLDRNSGSLYQINSNNQLSQLSDGIKFSNIKWADSSYGIGVDASGNFYIINNGVASHINDLPSGLGRSTTFAISPNHTIYLADGSNIYAGTVAAGFKPIFRAGTAPTLITAGPNGLVALVYNTGDGGDKGEQSSITILRSNGQKLAHKKIEAYDAQWSPNGRYLITTTDANSQIVTSSLQTISVVPNNNVNNSVWLDNNTILYNIGNQIWEYSLSTRSAVVVATAPKGHVINAIELGDDDNYVYLSVQSSPGSNDDLIIERFGLKGQISSANINILQQNLPIIQEGRCLLSLTNFSHPTIQIFGGQPEDNCQAAAEKYIQGLGVNPSELTYMTTAVPPDEPLD